MSWQTLRLSRPLIVTLMAGMLVLPALAAPPEGKGKPDHVQQNDTHPGKGKSRNGDDGWQQEKPGKPSRGKHAKDHDDDPQQHPGRDGGGSPPGDLATAGLTVTQVRGWADELHLGGYSPLPPGIARNYARGKPLPPGIAKKTVPAPLLQRLPGYPGYEWRIVGRDIALIGIRDRIVANILVDVLR